MDNSPIKPGTYVVAVSGGIDSVVLLHVLHSLPDMHLVVAHYDHGIRPDSALDRLFVEQLAQQYGLPYVSVEGNLGPSASEDQARQARYEFLHSVRSGHNARAIVTAHHQDDVLETAIHNIGRGTGPAGLASLNSRPDIIRPFLHMSKANLRAYAKAHNLRWREDSTNSSDKYRRNYIRHHILPRFSAAQRQEFAQRIQVGRELNQKIMAITHDFLDANMQDGALNRHAFIMLDHTSARTVMAAWLRRNNIRNFDKKTIERLTHAAKTYDAGKRTDINSSWVLEVTKDKLALKRLER